MTSRSTIEQWFDDAVAKKARWLIIGYDNFSYEAYPIPVQENEDVWARLLDLTNDMGSGYKEVYDLNLDKKAQLEADRVFNMPERMASKSIKQLENETAEGELISVGTAQEVLDDVKKTMNFARHGTKFEMESRALSAWEGLCKKYGWELS